MTRIRAAADSGSDPDKAGENLSHWRSRAQACDVAGLLGWLLCPGLRRARSACARRRRRRRRRRAALACAGPPSDPEGPTGPSALPGPGRAGPAEAAPAASVRLSTRSVRPGPARPSLTRRTRLRRTVSGTTEARAVTVVPVTGSPAGGPARRRRLTQAYQAAAEPRRVRVFKSSHDSGSRLGRCGRGRGRGSHGQSHRGTAARPGFSARSRPCRRGIRARGRARKTVSAPSG